MIKDRIGLRRDQAGLSAVNSLSAPYAQDRCKVSSRTAALRACYPRDLVAITKNISDYEGHPPVLDKEHIDRAVELYFAR